MFNPPHIGHLICAQEAVVRLGLDVVVLMPVGEAPHREIAADPGAEARLTMCEHATSADGRLAVSRVEVDRPGRSYTADTLRELSERPADDELVLILGGDEVASLRSWHEPEAVLALATVAAVEREGRRRGEILEAVAGLPGAEAIEFFDMPRVDVSSSLVRGRVAAGLPIRYLVPEEVANFIGAESLYGASTPVVAR